MALQEALGALVADDGVDVIVGALPANQEGVIYRRRGSAKHWSIEKGYRVGQNTNDREYINRTKSRFQHVFTDLQVMPIHTRSKFKGAKLFT